jgi:hypothetical protein
MARLKYMHTFKWGIFYGYASDRHIWIRVAKLHYGLSLKWGDKTFTERYVYVKYLPLPFGWRFKILKAKRKW